MEDIVASSTALATSRMRAIHTRRDPHPIISDAWGDKLVPLSALQLLVQQMAQTVVADDTLEQAEVERLADDYLVSSPAFANVILRSRYTEDALAAAIAAGTDQYVLIGAGFDSYFLRRPAQAGHVSVIEIDHPASQALKRQRLDECEVDIPEGVHFVSADLSRVSLAQALKNSAFDASRPAFFSWLGVTMYLTREANMQTLRSVAQVGAPGSELVFSYIDQAMFDVDNATAREDFDDLEQSVRAVGEPLVGGFHPAALADDLQTAGLELAEGPDDIELLQRYDPQGLGSLQAVEASHIARAAVGQ